MWSTKYFGAFVLADGSGEMVRALKKKKQRINVCSGFTKWTDRPRGTQKPSINGLALLSFRDADGFLAFELSQDIMGRLQRHSTRATQSSREVVGPTGARSS